MPYSDIMAFVMAADQSSRFGSAKRVATLNNGNTLLSSTLLAIKVHFPISRVAIKTEGLVQLKNNKTSKL